MSKIFIFRQEDRDKNWVTISQQLEREIYATQKFYKKDFEVEIREFKKRRSGRQLRAYWVIIKTVTDWMNSNGNTFTTDQVSDWFKIEAGHCNNIKGRAIPKSIANRSDCTKEQMETLIKTIIVFGAENLITNCYIEEKDLEELLKYYK